MDVCLLEGEIATHKQNDCVEKSKETNYEGYKKGYRTEISSACT